MYYLNIDFTVFSLIFFMHFCNQALEKLIGRKAITLQL